MHSEKGPRSSGGTARKKDKGMADKASMTLNLDEELNGRVIEAARAAGTNKTEWIRGAIVARLEDDSQQGGGDGDLEKIEAAYTVADEAGRSWLAQAADMVRKVY